jgi:class 3 adenylate cyclase
LPSRTHRSQDRRIEFRIGINVGDIIIDDGDIYGDGVNIAARVKTLSSPRAICISDNAYQQIKGKLTLEVSDMGEQQLKNIAQPLRIYSVRLEDTTARPALARRRHVYSLVVAALLIRSFQSGSLGMSMPY